MAERGAVAGGGWRSFTRLSAKIDAGELFGEHSAALGSTLPADSRRAASNGSREVPETWSRGLKSGGTHLYLIKDAFPSFIAMVVKEFWSVFSIFAASWCPSVLMHLKDDRRHCN